MNGSDQTSTTWPTLLELTKRLQGTKNSNLGGLRSATRVGKPGPQETGHTVSQSHRLVDGLLLGLQDSGELDRELVANVLKPSVEQLKNP